MKGIVPIDNPNKFLNELADNYNYNIRAIILSFRFIFRIPQHSSIIRVKNGHGNNIEAAQKLLPSDSQLTSAETSTESSRISSASHSRNSSTGIPNNPGNASVTVSILNEGSKHDEPRIRNTVLSSFAPIAKNTKKSANTMPGVASTQALLDPDTNLPNA